MCKKVCIIGNCTGGRLTEVKAKVNVSLSVEKIKNIEFGIELLLRLLIGVRAG